MGNPNPLVPSNFNDYMEITYKSRKFILSVACLVLLTALTLATILYPSLAGILPTFISGVVGVLSLYFTGNIANKYVMNKTLPVAQTNGIINTLPPGAQTTTTTVVTTPVSETERKEDTTAEA